MSNMSNAVVAGLRTTGTGSGGDGICNVSGGLVMGNYPITTELACILLRLFFEAKRKVVGARDKRKHERPSLPHLHHLLPLIPHRIQYLIFK
jgi:hypothetical protein